MKTTGPTLTVLATAALLLVHSGAFGLSLGRLTVQSSLGEALRAEIDVSSITPDEAASLRTALASPEAFRAAGVEFNPVLAGAQATLAKRADGRSVIRLSGDRSVSEPFLDVILDLAWSGGRLQRSYTLLIDPPTRGASPAPAPAPAAVTSPALSQAPAPAVPLPPAATAPASPPAPAPTPAPRPTPRAEAPSAPPSAAAGDNYRVRAGDTLSSIASAHTRPGVSLDQMLVALYRGNPQAFAGNNMNRLKSGVVVNLSDAQAAAKDVSPSEARSVIQAQSADFAAFRQRLAGAAPKVRSNEPPRQTKGTVEAAVQDRKADTAAPDKLTLSKGGLKASSAEASLSKETERKAAETRVAELARNVEDLKRLSANAVQGAAPAASVSKAASAAPLVPALPVTAPAAVPASAASVAASSPVPAMAASVAVSVVAPVVASAASVAASMPEPVVVPASAAASVVVAPASEPVVASAPSAASAPVSAPVVEGPGFLAGLLDNPFVMPGAVGLVALLATLGVMRLRRRNQEGSGETSFIESKLQPDSFFGASGGQRVDTRDGPHSASSSLSYSLSQLDAIGDVDPVAEADVYLAYGRDLQAEEILKEALRSDGGRLSIRTKLLEVYVKRADVKAFDLQARQLHELTKGEGEDWQRAAELGRQIDPDNPLYSDDGALGSVAPVAAASLAAAALQMDDELPSTRAEASAAGNFAIEDTLPLDIPAAAASPAGPSTDFDIDIDLDSPSALTGLESTRPLTGDVQLPDAPAPVAEEGPMDFSVEPMEEAPAPKDAENSGPVDFDFGDLSLDLDTPPAAASAAGAAGEADLDLDGEADAGDPLARKIELADEFRRIGDTEGARDLLEEVVSKADGALRARAQALLDELS